MRKMKGQLSILVNLFTNPWACIIVLLGILGVVYLFVAPICESCFDCLAEKQNLTQANRICESEKFSLSEEIKGLNSAISNCNDDLAACDKTTADLRNELADCRNNLSICTSELADCRSELEKCDGINLFLESTFNNLWVLGILLLVNIPVQIFIKFQFGEESKIEVTIGWGIFIAILIFYVFVAGFLSGASYVP